MEQKTIQNKQTIMDDTEDLYSVCTAQLAADNATDSDALLQCFSKELSQQTVSSSAFPREILILLCAALVFLMQAGFAMVVAGAVQKKNVGNSMLKNLLDACGGAVAFFFLGYAFAFGGIEDSTKDSGKTFIGTTGFLLIGVEDYAFWLFQYTYSAASATIVAGTLAERCQMMAYCCYSILLCGFIYPVIAHAIWSHEGFLSPVTGDPLFGVGMIDFAGSGVVHLTGGVTALLATTILGPRHGRFHDEMGRPLTEPREFPGTSIGLQMLGTFLLWFGWYGFNGGAALLLVVEDPGPIAALASANTALAGGTAGIVAMLTNYYYLDRVTGEAFFDIKYAMNGSLCGLVAVTGGCGVIEPWAATIIGAVAGMLYCGSSRTLVKLRLDDAVDAIPVHMVNGIWGCLAVGLFAVPSKVEHAYGTTEHAGWFYSSSGDGTLLGAQLIGVLFILSWTTFFMYPFFIWLNYMGWFRSDPLEEIIGLDRSYHGGAHLLPDVSSVHVGGGSNKSDKSPGGSTAYEHDLGLEAEEPNDEDHV